MAATCARTGCAKRARAVLSFDPGAATARLVDLTDDDVGAARLCTEHADRIRVPSGWTLTDERTEEPDGLGVLLGLGTHIDEPEPESPLLKRAFRVIS